MGGQTLPDFVCSLSFACLGLIMSVCNKWQVLVFLKALSGEGRAGGEGKKKKGHVQSFLSCTYGKMPVCVET